MSSSATRTRLSLARSFSTCSSLGLAAPPPPPPSRSSSTDMGKIAAQLKEQLGKGKVVEREYYPLVSPGIAPVLPPPREIRPLGIKRSEIKNLPERLKVMGYPDLLATLPITPLAYSLLSTLPASDQVPYPSLHPTLPTVATHLPSLSTSPSSTPQQYSFHTPKATDAPYRPGKNKVLTKTLVLGRDGEVVDIGERGKWLKPSKEEKRRRSLELVRELKGLKEKEGLDRFGKGEFEWLTEEEEGVRRGREMEGIF